MLLGVVGEVGRVGDLGGGAAVGHGGEGRELCFELRVGRGRGEGRGVGVGEGELVGVVAQPVGIWWWWPPAGSSSVSPVFFGPLEFG